MYSPPVRQASNVETLPSLTEKVVMSESLKVLVSDKLSERGLQPLFDADGISVEICTDLSPEELVSRIPEYHALLIRSRTQVTPDLIGAGKRLQAIGRAGTGVDNIDVEAATRAGVTVVNTPTGNTVAAAEHTIAMLMALARNIPQADRNVRSKLWDRGAFVGTEVRGKALGIVGLGRIAQEVVQFALSLGMRVYAYDPYVSQEYASQRHVTLISIDEMLPLVDFLTVHVPLTDATRNILDADRLKQLKKGARVLNVARGGVIDEEALAAAVACGHLGGAALDVFETEPLPENSPLRNNDKIILTPHLGASTVEAMDRVAEDVAVQVLDILQGRPALHAVNAPILPPTALNTIIPYIDLAERMGRFLRQIDEEGIRRLEITGHGPVTAFDMAYIVASAIRGVLSGIVEERVNLINAELMARSRGIEIVQRKMPKHERYESMITLRLTSASGTNTVLGTVLLDELKIVAVNDLWVEFPAAGNLLLASHTDRPGMIGKVGTLLGQSDVNISFMHVGRRAPRGESIMVLGTDEQTPAKVLKKLANIQDIRWLKAVELRES